MLPIAALALGVIQNGNLISVDSGANLTFQINRANGDITSLRYHGLELQSTERKFSQIASGLGAAEVSVKKIGEVIVVTVSAHRDGITHYYIARKGDDTLYMATYAPTLLPVGELRFIARLNRAILPYSTNQADEAAGRVVEGKDVFLLPSGITSSKFFSGRQAAEDLIHGVYGPGIGVYMVMGSRESSSGGPFFKDVATQTTSVTKELYNYMYSGHTQTEPYRSGLHGPYALVFSDGKAPDPAAVDFRFIDSLGLIGHVGRDGRGAIDGTVGQVAETTHALIALRNSAAQYWTSVSRAGRYEAKGIKAGSYTLTLYQGELEVASKPVTISAGKTSHQPISAQALPGKIIWQIGTHDGRPDGFMNADKLATMHPSDVRMNRWNKVVYTVGQSRLDSFPSAQWAAVNDPTTIHFRLSSARDLRLRIAVSLSQMGARPQIEVNDRWKEPLPPVPEQPRSRGITRGSYRGNNTLYEFDIPASALNAGNNSLSMHAISGSSGEQFLSPGFVYDSVMLVDMTAGK